MPSGEIIYISDKSGDTVRLQISKDDLNEHGWLKITTLSAENIPLGLFGIQILDDEDKVLIMNTENGWDGLLSTLIWISISVVTAGIIISVCKRKGLGDRRYLY